MEEILTFLQNKINFQANGKTDKIMSLPDAVRRFVKPKMSIQFGNGMTTPTAIFFEIARQFWGKDPQFTLVGISGGAYNLALFVHGRLCKKIICAFTGDGYPFPGPNPILTRAFQDRSLEIEYWSQLTIVLRFMAGAMGVPFFPTKSLHGSSMEICNTDAFRQIPNPFDKNEAANVVCAYQPDIAIAHGWAADADGNTIFSVPHSGNHFGALAAKNGVIVTVEKIVDADFIRRHAHMTKLPSYIVRAVCPAPLGGFPMGIHPLGVDGVEGYAEDEEWIMEARNASRKTEDYQAWVNKWVLGCKTHDDFLNLLGKKHIQRLKEKIRKNAWMSELAEMFPRLPSPQKPTAAEVLVSVAARKIEEIVQAKKYRLALCGIGVSNLAAWLAYYHLQRQGYLLELVAEIGYYGYRPQPADPYVFNLRNIDSCSMLSDIFTSLAIFMSGAHSFSVGIIGAGQVDKFGNVNTTRISAQGPYLVGSGGANDVASGASETIVTLEQTKERFPEKVDYITSPGEKVSTVVTQLGTFEKEPGRNELILTGYVSAGDKASEEDIVREIKQGCGWNLKVKNELRVFAPPSDEDVLFIRCFDPKRYFLGSTERKKVK